MVRGALWWVMIWGCSTVDTVDTASKGAPSTPASTPSTPTTTTPTSTTPTTPSTTPTTPSPSYVYPYACDPKSYDPIPVDAQSSVTPLTTLPTIPECSSEAYPYGYPHRYGDFAPSLDLSAMCPEATQSSHFMRPYADLPEAAPYEVHVVSHVRQSEQDCEGWGVCSPSFASVPVRVHPTVKPVVLVLYGYEGTRWELDPQPGSRIAGVFTLGNSYNDTQQVSGSPVPAVHVPDAEYTSGLCARYFTPWEPDETWYYDARLTALLVAVEEAFGVTARSYQGCDYAGRFEVPAAACPDMAPPERVELDTDLPNASVGFAECDAVAQESAMCLAKGFESLYVVGLESGDVCPYISEPWSGGLLPHSSALTWTGEAAYRCEHSGLMRYDLVHRTVEPMNVYCNGIEEDEGVWYSQSPYLGTLYENASFEAMIAGDFSAVYALTSFASRLMVHDGIAYSAFIRDDALMRVDLSTGLALEDWPLETEVDYIHSLDMMSDGTLVTVSEPSFAGSELELFDLSTGAHLRTIPLPAADSIGEYGLVCLKR